MQAVLGLGNPGAEYASSRHNIGFLVVSAFRARYRLPAFERESPSEVSRGRFRGRRILLARPQTFMNRSGDAMRALMRSDGLTPGDTLVVLDDVYLPLGRLRIRRTGGDGGHRGLSSLIEAAGTEELPRLRVGVGRPEGADDLADYVLEDFEESEQQEVSQVVKTAVEAVATFLTRGVDAAMNSFNALSP